MSIPVTDRPLHFGRFELRTAERVLRADGQEVPLGGRAFDVLACLAQRRHRLVTKQELLDEVWPGLVVEEHNIATQVGTLRKLLGPQAITTVPGRGYRFTAVVDGDAAPSDAPPAGPAAGPAAAALTPLLGRDADLVALADLLERQRLVTLVGAGGMGKSLLARHLLARLGGRHADGACWVELASLGDAGLVPARIAEAVGVRLSGDDPVAALAAAMGGLSMLLALDNAEHLGAAFARIAAALHDAAPGVRLLVTSQAPLRLAVERVYRVGPLAVPPGPLPAVQALAYASVALFVDRARGADARFQFGDDQAVDVIELCRQLDGLPLAIELAAARAPLLGVRRLVAMLGDRLKLLTRNRDLEAPARQRTLRAALDWSHALLDETERAVFRRLGVVVDSASLDVIEHIVADESGELDAWAALDALQTLVERSLVALLPGDDVEPRYRLLESPRALAVEHLAASGELAAVQRRHAVAIAARLDRAWDERWSGRVGILAWAAGVSPDAGNARAAIEWARAAGEAEIALTVAVPAMAALPIGSHAQRAQLRELCESLAGQATRPSLRLWALISAVMPGYHPSRVRSLEIATQAVDFARGMQAAGPEPWLLYRTLSTWIRAAAGVEQADRSALIDAVAELNALEDPAWPAHRLSEGCSARWSFEQVVHPGPTGNVRQEARRILTLQHAAGGPVHAWTPIVILAELECGDVQAARQLGEGELATLADSRDEFTRMQLHAYLAAALLLDNDPVPARQHLHQAWRRAVPLRLQNWWADLPPLLAVLEGRTRTAARLVGHADAAYARQAMTRNAVDLAARDRTASLARAALGEAAFAALEAQGRDLRDDEALELAFAEQDRA